MTVQQQTPYNTYTGNGVTTVFAYQFKILAKTDLSVYVAGVLKAVDADYTVTGIGIDAGGSITFVSGAPAAAASVSILRSMKRQRLTDYQLAGDFNTPTVNPDFDSPILMLQDLAVQLQRSLTLPIDEVGTLPTLPAKAARVGKYIAFDAAGLPVASVGTGNDSALRVDLADSSTSGLGNKLVAIGRTPQEALAGLVPVSPSYVPGHLYRWMTQAQINDASLQIGSIDVSAAVQNAINSGHDVYAPDGRYWLNTTSLTGRTHLKIQGQSIENTKFVYDGATNAFSFAGKARMALMDFSIYTTATAANAIRLGGGSDGINAARQVYIRNVSLNGDTSAANTGAGLLLHGGGLGDPYSGSLFVVLLNTLGYKYGIKGVGVDSNATWTTMTFQQCLINGRTAGPIVGSRGIFFDALTNAVGSSWQDGAIQGFERPVEFAYSVPTAGYGMDVRGDFEGNTGNLPLLGANVTATVENGSSGTFSRARASAGIRAFYEQIDSGIHVVETYRGWNKVIPDTSAGEESYGTRRGASVIGGGTPPFVHGGHASTSGDLTAPERNYHFAANGVNKMCWGAASPASGTWVQGDICWKTTVAAAGSMGWMCTTGGTPGTWKAMPNVAA